MSGQAHLAGLFAGANPDSSGASDQREGIVANQFGRSRKFEADGIGCKRPDGAELIRHAEDNAGSIRAIGNEFGVVGQQGKFLIDSLTREAARDDLLAADESVNAQIAPRLKYVA